MKKFSLPKKILSAVLTASLMLAGVSTAYADEALAQKKVFIVGDSTGCNYSESSDPTHYYKRVGFGTRLPEYLKPEAEVVNLALSGRSSKSFTADSNYTVYKNSIKSGDAVIIAFGHNDEKDDAARHTDPNGDKETEGSFKNSLYVNYILPALEAGATPILATPIVRRSSSGKLSDTNMHITSDGDYPKAIRELAAELGLEVIDNTQMTADLYNSLTPTETADFHAWLANSLASVDATHLNNYGAAYVAYLMAGSLKNSGGALSAYVKDGIEAPSKEENLIVNSNYKEPDTSNDPTEAELKASVFKVTEPWYATAFGNIGGVSKLKKGSTLTVNDTTGKTNFEITETGEKTVNIRTGHADANIGFGKINDTLDSFTLYYIPVDAASNYEISADAKVNAFASGSSEVSFGAVCLDRIEIDASTATPYNYVAAGAVKYGANAYVTFARGADQVLKTNTVKNYTPAVGETVKVKIVKTGNKFKVTYGDVTETYEAEMSGTVYFGFYTVRNADVTFSNIVNNNEVVEEGTGEIEDAVVYGDANADGELRANDSAIILQRVLKSGYETELEIKYGNEKALKYLDVNADGDITAADSAMVLQKVLNNSFLMTVEEQ